MAPFGIPFYTNPSSPSSMVDRVQSYLEKGNNLCISKNFPLKDKFIKEIIQIYTKCKEVLDGEHRKDTPLILASRLGLAHLVLGFIECARSTNTDLQTSKVGEFQEFLGHVNWIGDTALHVAAANNNSDVVNVLLKNVSLDQLISYRNINGKTPLFLLSSPKYVENVFAILDKAAMAEMDMSSSSMISINDRPEESKDETESSKRHDKSTWELFKLAFGDINDIISYEKENLHLATAVGDVKHVKEIIENDPSQMYHRNHDGETPAFVAAKEGHLDILRMMIKYFKTKHDNIPSLLTRKGAKENALHIAIRSYHPGVIFWLIKHVPNLVSHLNLDEETPLYMAVERGRGAIVKLILENYKINISEEGHDNKLLYVAACSGSAECVGYLLSSNPNLMHKPPVPWDGRYALDVAVCNGYLSVAKELLDRESSIGYVTYKKNERTTSAIHSAVEEGQSDILELLISKCPGCMDITNENGNNILHVAIEKKRRTIIEFIFQHKSLAQLINQKNNQGNTPIHLLVLQAFSKTVSETVTNIFRKNLEKFSEPKSKPKPKPENEPLSEPKPEFEPELDAILKFITDARVDLEAINNDSLTPITILPSHESRGRLLKAIKATPKWKINDAYLSDEAQRHFQMMDQIVIVAALIATASFAAAFAVPGGFDGNQGQTQGMPVLLKKPAYKTFVVTNALAFICSCCVLFENIRMLLNRYTKNKIFEEELDRINGRAFAMYVLVGMAMVTMAIAFITGTYVVLTPSLGFAISLCCTCLVIVVSTSLLSVKFGGLVHKIMYPIAKEKITGQSAVV